VLWGDSAFPCVLTDASVVESYFDTAGGYPRRAKVDLTFIELQEEEAAVGGHGATQAQPSSVPSGQVAGGRVFGPEP
jgi:hypothetical protein